MDFEKSIQSAPILRIIVRSSENESEGVDSGRVD